MAKNKGSGRKAGVPNKKTALIADVAERLGVNPFEVLCLFAANKWKELGYTGSKHIDSETGTEWFESPISLDIRMNAAKEACKYLYPQRKAVQLSTDEESGFRIVIEDYAAKGNK